MPEELFRDLMNRTIYNYEFIKERQGREGPYEVTQLVSALITAVGLPREQDLSEYFQEITLEQAQQTFGLPAFSVLASHPEYGIRNMNDLARMFRNAVAHGNIEFGRWHAQPDTIGTITLEDHRTDRASGARQERRTQPLTVHELERTLYAFQRMANDIYDIATRRTA